ncbi:MULTISPECIES: hypothetical protein [Sphingobium]|uniref:Uncharacterized protein n=1 Tax=Sphingobium fuliginis (strain ATCC 27551) TaxID=336203 RepID=A0A292ZM26_SPHSA|nr:MULTISPECIES: hypothetical protein [Sphingobium]MCB4862942.1 hypothetical protein [Sphingobium sp. PNB]QOT73737.1 hypothetical protein H5V43_21305 [Sphingobium fuliginis]UXC93206.1 hypothetical protein EGM87_23195 [Sphingobium sp. RSMS]WDA35804.1 hypothetical protein PO876_20470 [Sphingobium sp. YC-XJ3]GAY23885.1 hypothetical protein SFOMI_4463 [Sphingobium fuliginis]
MKDKSHIFRALFPGGWQAVRSLESLLAGYGDIMLLLGEEERPRKWRRPGARR